VFNRSPGAREEHLYIERFIYYKKQKMERNFSRIENSSHRLSPMSQSLIAKNLKTVKDKIAQAALRAGRNPQEVQLVTVSKTVSGEQIQQAIEAGVTILGENYIQEARKKIEELGNAVRWDFIGHLQSNKASYAIDLFEVIHSVDRLSLARALSTRAAKKSKTVRILVQVNISGEEAKSGIDTDGVNTLVNQIASLPNLTLEGLMTMPPYFTDPEKARPYFAALRELRDTLMAEQGNRINLKELSMGMSGDFEVAIEEGATLVRVGTAIFGKRPYA
jgi:pyridoxal phosphate enzyme (YggS family)